MKFAKITLSVALLGALTLGMADDAATTDTTSGSTTTTTSTSTSTSVDSQIAAIQAAPAQERVQLMNQFKQRLANMNQEDRMAAIAQMQEKMQAQAGAHMQAGQAMGEQTRTAAKEMAQEKQMQANEQMAQMQNMNQRQAGNQFMNMPGNAPATSMPMSGGAGATGGASNFNMNMRH